MCIELKCDDFASEGLDRRPYLGSMPAVVVPHAPQKLAFITDTTQPHVCKMVDPLWDDLARYMLSSLLDRSPQQMRECRDADLSALLPKPVGNPMALQCLKAFEIKHALDDCVAGWITIHDSKNVCNTCLKDSLQDTK